MSLISKVRATLEMIKVVVVEFQSALRALGEFGSIGKMGFRTLQDSLLSPAIIPRRGPRTCRIQLDHPAIQPHIKRSMRFSCKNPGAPCSALQGGQGSANIRIGGVHRAFHLLSPDETSLGADPELSYSTQAFTNPL